MKESKIIRQVLLGNSSAFGYFVDNYQHMAITIAYRIVGNMQDAEDIVQESFIRAFKNLSSFRKESKFSSWFYRIVYNRAISASKKKVWIEESNVENYGESDVGNYGESDVESVEWGRRADSEVEKREQKELVEAILKAMPVGEALILTLFYLEENSIKEIASITGLSKSNIKVRLYRGRERFRNLWLKRENYGKAQREA